jgi:hypothetical protein
MSLPAKITIPADYGFSFDFMSIYEVKTDKNPNDVTCWNNFIETREHISAQIGASLMQLVEDSQEYANLYQANLELFELVDLAKTNSVSAKQVDDGVYKRFLAKRALQNKFFPEAAKVEQKFGYEQK